MATPSPSLSPAILHFPSEPQVLQYLQNHQKTRDMYLGHKKTVEKVAQVFANTAFDPLRVHPKVVATIREVNPSANIADSPLRSLSTNLGNALTQYPQDPASPYAVGGDFPYPPPKKKCALL